MKTVQEVLREMDKEQLIYSYLERCPISVKTLEDTENMSAAELISRAKTRIGNFIEYMRTVPVKHSEYTPILFVAEYAKEYFLENIYVLVYKDELLEKGLEAPSYAYEFTPQDEIAGFYVADVKRTQKDLIGLMTDVLFEASFFGFEQEAMESEKAELDRRINEIESGNAELISEEDMMEEMYEKFGLEHEKRSNEELKFREAYDDVYVRYNKYLYDKALKEVMEMIKDED